MEFFDSHSHYNDEKFKADREQVLNEVYKSGITKLVCAGYSLESSEKAVEIANTHDFIYATCGISPNDIEEIKTEEDLNNNLKKLEPLAKQEKVVAIGEIGLDYYWNKENKELQKQVFKKQIELSNNLNLPIVIHTRDAISDTINILKNEIISNKRGVFHCCPLNLELIKEGLKLGFYISFAGPITFKNSKNANEVISIVPLDRILIETDSPYLAPEPKRGTRNNSANVIYMAQKIAEVKNLELEQVANATYQNAKTIFEL